MPGVKVGGVPKVFSQRTLGQFEDASAGIPLRQLNRAFERAHLRPGEDPGGPVGARKIQFRRYVAGVDQGDPRQLDRLGDALGAMIEEVPTSKRDFLVTAAERDGFLFANGVFRPAETTARLFAVARVEDLASIDDRGRRLRLLADDNPTDAIGGATELTESVCRTVLRLLGKPAAGQPAGLAGITESTLTALELAPTGIGDSHDGAVLRACLQQLSGVVANLGELHLVESSGRGLRGNRKGPLPRHARLAVGAAVTFTAFVAETYLDRAR